MKKTRLYLVDDQVLFVDMLTSIMSHRTDDLEVIGSATSGEEALKAIPELKPDIVLLDVRMPGIDGIEVIGRLQSELPGLKVVMLTTFQDVAKARSALNKGASGFLLKNSSVNDLIEKIQTIQKGDVVISSQIAEKMFSPSDTEQEDPPSGEEQKQDLSQLSRREQEVYELLIQGFSNSEIADKLFIARQTVKNHIYSIYSKIGHRDRFKIISRKND